MRKQRKNRLQRTLRCRRTSREIDDQRPPSRSANGTAQSRQWSLPSPLRAHAFSQAFHNPVADPSGRLWSHIAGCKSCASRRDNQIRSPRGGKQSGRNRRHLVRNRLLGDGRNPCLFQQIRDYRSGDILPNSLKTAVAYSQYHRLRLGAKTCGHHVSLPIFRSLRRQSGRSGFTKDEKIIRDNAGSTRLKRLKHLS